MGESSVTVETSICKMSKSWGLNVQHIDCSERYCIVYVKVAMRLNLRVITRKKNCHTMCGDEC